MNKTLPTKNQYTENIDVEKLKLQEWSVPMYQCEKCKGGMRKKLTEVCLTNPPQYIYKCDNCGHVDYLYI